MKTELSKRVFVNKKINYFPDLDCLFYDTLFYEHNTTAIKTV